MVHRWHPWRHLRDRYPQIDVALPKSIEVRCMGRLLRDRIEIDGTSNQAERRCTLTHEIIHLERGPVPSDPYLAAREEQAVELLTARRLIHIERLVEALAWNQARIDRDTAEELWVDLPTLQTRIQYLTRDERAHINRELARRQPWNN